jgi:hypothetical protein
VKTETPLYGLVTFALRLALVLGLLTTGWLVYTKLPHQSPDASDKSTSRSTVLQVLLQPGGDASGLALDIPVEIYPVDVVAVRHEYFAERRAGKTFDDFLNERMKGRAPVSARLDKDGQASVNLPEGNWWVHATLSGNEDLEWRLPISVSGGKQIVELTPQNAYTRAKSF